MPLSNMAVVNTPVAGYEYPTANPINEVSMDESMNPNLSVDFSVQATGMLVILLIIALVWVSAKWPISA